MQTVLKNRAVNASPMFPEHRTSPRRGAWHTSVPGSVLCAPPGPRGLTRRRLLRLLPGTRRSRRHRSVCAAMATRAPVAGTRERAWNRGAPRLGRPLEGGQAQGHVPLARVPPGPSSLAWDAAGMCGCSAGVPSRQLAEVPVTCGFEFPSKRKKSALVREVSLPCWVLCSLFRSPLFQPWELGI